MSTTLNNTPAIGRYNAQAKYDGENWVFTEQHNTIGTITPDGLSLMSSGLFRVNYTNVKAQGLNGANLYSTVIQITANQIEFTLSDSASVNDIILIEVEVFNDI